MTSAPPLPPITPELAGELAARAGRPDFPRLEAQLRSSGYCARPVRLKGTIETCDGHGRRRVWSTATEPEGILRKACGNRREAVCPPCAERYRQDAYHLIRAGLRGGKGVPDTITEHPALFVTLTAPSFGVVHTRRLDVAGEPRRCRPRRDAETCAHGVRLSCGAVHDGDDPCLGEPLCPYCFDYAGALAWNNTLGELWRYTTIYVPRALARLAGLTQQKLKREVRPAYVKVAEYQRRGLVHLHVLARLDRAMPDYRADELHRPPPRYTVGLLEAALRAAVADVSAPVVDELGGGRARWGDELDVRPLRSGAERGEIAGYLAKYATKSTEQAGGLLHRVGPEHVEHAPVREHVRCFLRTAFRLPGQADPPPPRPARRDPRLVACAHAFGYRGHCLTKSRRYSTTFKALRAAREAFVHEQILARSSDATQRAIAVAETRAAAFQFVGTGHVTAADAFLAASAAARAREHRRLAREERTMQSENGR